MDELQEAIAAILMGFAHLDEEEAREVTDQILDMMQDCGNYQEHAEPNPVGTNLFGFKPYRWEYNGHGELPTIAKHKEAEAEMEQRLVNMGIDRQALNALAAIRVLDRMGLTAEVGETDGR